MNKQRYTKGEYEIAQSQNIFNYLNEIGYGLNKESTNYYRSELHSSLVIQQNGKWFWNSKDLNGQKPVELLKQILMTDENYNEKDAYITAIKSLVRTDGINPSELKDKKLSTTTGQKNKENIEMGNIILPPRNSDNKRVFAYLSNSRRIDNEIIKELISCGKLYETKEHHNACFVCHDKQGIARHAYKSGTITFGANFFKTDVTNSDKSYGLALAGRNDVKKCFALKAILMLYLRQHFIK